MNSEHVPASSIEGGFEFVAEELHMMSFRYHSIMNENDSNVPRLALFALKTLDLLLRRIVY